ncbi:MAG: catechol 2,3-dioxygenase, partial [Trebonia sp.]|nr:catechol 2,3-dioxygenase [Trebonia sp.]
RDVAHIGHAELLTPTPEASLEYFTALLGLTVVSGEGGSWYLRDYLAGAGRLHHLAFWVDSREDVLRAGWGARLPATFRTYGTPPLGAPEESVISDWPAPALPPGDHCLLRR